MRVVLANTWEGICIGMIISAFFLWRLSNGNLRKCWHEIRDRGAAALPSCFWRFRWHAVFMAFAYGATLALVVGLHRLFAGIETSETGLTLDYPWPRSDVYLDWKDVTAFTVESHHFKRGYSFRLRVEAGSSIYISPWTGREETQRARDLIQAHLNKREKQNP